ncbi:MAG: polysaccharide ABC transporter ATP-binding protein [Thermodesulfobacteriota bacterium]|nr:polysaccharide ABC transporter ATP-binding protein [Thermodesulfobacteriota bacterium]
MSDSDVLVEADNVSKKFCRRLKRALWYGLQDLTSELLGHRSNKNALRKDEFWAVDAVSFELKRGECLGLIGPNGAGKSTLLKMLNGLIKPDKGRIAMRGRVGALIELGAGFNPVLTGLENIYVNAAVMGIPKDDVDHRLNAIIEFAEIADFLDMPLQHYSSGMKVRLGFAVAAQLEPDVLIIDEVLAVGDIGFKIKCLNAVNELMRESAVIFVSHSMEFVSQICTRIMVLDSGKAEYHDADVASGIDYYYSKFGMADRHVCGSGSATVSHVKLYGKHQGASNEQILVLGYGDDLVIEMGLLLDSRVIRPAIHVDIQEQGLRHLTDCFSSFCGFEVSPKRYSKIRLELSNLHLNMGLYSITIAVRDLSNGGEVLTRNTGLARFRVKAPYKAHTPFILTGKWSQQ